MGILLVYDVTDEASFNNIRNWMKNIETHASSSVNKVRPPSGPVTVPPLPASPAARRLCNCPAVNAGLRRARVASAANGSLWRPGA